MIRGTSEARDRVPPVGRRTSPPPEALRGEIASVLIGPSRLRRRIAQMGARITADYSDKEVVVIALLNGTLVFLADLIRTMDFPFRIETLRVSSYSGGTPDSSPRIREDLPRRIRGRHVLVVDDILDTGRTLAAVTRRLRQARPASLRICVLLDKTIPRSVDIRPDYVGFRVPDVFVVGYGLDFAERHRNLPFVAELRADTH
ncbi:MAG: hypoxanthine phosphoribosyltransferase [Verrucomicrobiales bacterium]|nr:hypoxanthine phosphoribosyltransferase [Verrucomicrobiales bacterium]